MLPFERAFKKTWLGHIFVRNWRPNQKCTFLAGLPWRRQSQIPTKYPLFWQAYPTPLRRRSMILVPREAQNLSQSMFSCMLIPFSMFLLDSDEGKVKYSPNGRESKVVGDFGRSPFSCIDWLTLFQGFYLKTRGKVKYSPLYGRGSKVTILVGRHFQSGKPFQHQSRFLLEIGVLTRNVAVRKSVQKNLIGTHFC